MFELPVVRARVVEHRLESVGCPCGAVTSACWPAGVSAPAVYGPRLRTAAVYLYQGQHVSRLRAARAVGDLLEVPVSAGSASNFQAMAHEGLAEFADAVKDKARQAQVLGADETGLRCEGKTVWLHVARNEELTVMEVHEKRGAEAMRDIGVLDEFSGILVRDALASYDAVGPEEGRAGDQLCASHLARNLAAVSEFVARHPQYAGPCGWDWAEQASRALWEVERARKQALGQICPPEVLSGQRHLIASPARTI